MSIKLRFALLLGLLLIIFLGCLAVLRLLEKQQLTEALATSQRDATGMLERWLDLSGSSLRQFSEDYSRWDEMVRFVDTRDPAWAEVNIRQSLAGFDVQEVWIIAPDGTAVFQASRPEATSPDTLLSPEKWRQLIAENPFPHFFQQTPAGLLELRAAPIQPSADTDRKTPAKAWLLAARLWDEGHLLALGKLTESTIHLDAPKAAPDSVAGKSRLTLIRPLADWRGETAAILYVTREMPAIARRLQTDVFEARVFIVFGLLVMGALALSLHQWVLKPLNQIGESLARQDATKLAPLLVQTNELSRIAQRIRISFAQQRALRHEAEERARLGRDLHDGVIQGIYAAGMGLAAARTLIPTNPTEASQRIDQVRAALNQTIRDVRNFITGLEPEALQACTFGTAVAGVFEFFQMSGSVAEDLDIDEAAAERLPLPARGAALQIVRECTSNAVRHGKARRVRVSLRFADDRHTVRLEIVDDGGGFDPATAKRGQGLDNIAERARTLGATAEIVSERGKGTRATVIFPVTESSK